MGTSNLAPSTPADYVKLFDALSHPMRIKIVGKLLEKRRYVSELAKLVNISRPLLYMHLKKLEDAGLVSGSYEISSMGKSMRYFKLNAFDISINPGVLAALAAEIPDGKLE